MKRKDFLKGIGLGSASLSIPSIPFGRNKSPISNQDCVIVPSETAGPFPLDLTENEMFLRQDIRDDKEGVRLDLKIRVIGASNCEPMPNVRVNIWHCDKDGIYSGYNTGSNPGNTEAYDFRGYQFTDVNGEAEFVTIFPGWYPGRIAHMHFQIFVSSSYSAVSQFTFPLEERDKIYLDNPEIYLKGADPLDFSTDGGFRDGVEHQLATLEANTDSEGYQSFYEVAVDAVGTSGVGHLERATANIFEMGQNFPNPYTDYTTIPLTLKERAEVQLEIWNLSGNKVGVLDQGELSPGAYNLDVNPSKLNLPNGNYLYQLNVKTGNGIFRHPKMMTYAG